MNKGFDLKRKTYKQYLYLIGLSFSVMLLADVTAVSAETSVDDVMVSEEIEARVETLKADWQIELTESTESLEIVNLESVDETKLDHQLETEIESDELTEVIETTEEELFPISTDEETFLISETPQVNEVVNYEVESEQIAEEIVEVNTEMEIEEVKSDGEDDVSEEALLTLIEMASEANLASTVSLPVKQWVYNDASKTWEYYNDKGVVEQRLTSEGYWINNVKQKDKHIAIDGTSYYFDTNGQMIRDKWIYSNSMLAWFQANNQGVLVNEITPWGHYVNGNQRFDILATVQNKSYYFEPLEWGGNMSIGKWAYSPSANSWYQSKANGEVYEYVTPTYYSKNGVKETDKHVSIHGTSYYYDKAGKMTQNTLSYSESMMAWFKSNALGILTNEVTPWGHYVNGYQLFDTLVEVSTKQYYFEPAEWGGNMSMNKWAYSPSKNSWYRSNDKGETLDFVTPSSYVKSGVAQKDAHVSINGASYYFEPSGKMAQNKWAYSNTMLAWFQANNQGILTNEVTPWGHYVNGHQKFDVLTTVQNMQYYFEPAEWGGFMAMNKWSYSPTANSWYRSQADGVTVDLVTPNRYIKNGIAQKDAHISINGTSYYFEPSGKMAQNKWVYSDSMLAWFNANNKGVLTVEITPWGYYKNGLQQFDTVATANNNKRYYFVSRALGGTMSMNKWSESAASKLWYHSNAKGEIIYQDKVGPVLPNYVSLDKGQWTMYQLWQDGWPTGCWLRTAASGIAFAGGNVTPQMILNSMTRTDDPRTGMLSHPSIANNWSLGGAYSAAYPEALMSYINKHAPNAENITNASFEQIKRELANGNTVQIYYAWATPNITLNANNGLGSFKASKDYHSILLTGYNSTGFFHQEHWSNEPARNNHFSFSSLEWQYNTMGKKAIVYRPN